MTTTAVLLGAFLALSASGNARGAPAPKVAILPFSPSDRTHPIEGESAAAKMAAHLEGRYSVVRLTWESLRDLMDEHGLEKSRFSDREVARRIGRILSAEGVIIGRFDSGKGHATVHAELIGVRTGAVKKARPWRVPRDVIVPAAFLLSVAAPVLPEMTQADLKDSVRDYQPCENAAHAVDELEKHILDLKARFWALQLRRGVSMAGIKYNPGSTITDPDLKREFYSRMKKWHAEEIIPELTPLEIKDFAETDEKASRLARRCRIL